MEVSRDRSTQECNQELSEARDDAALPYRRSYDGLNRSGKAGMPYSHLTWRTTKFNSLLPCRMLVADELRVNKQ